MSTAYFQFYILPHCIILILWSTKINQNYI